MGAESAINRMMSEIRSPKADTTSRDQKTIERVSDLESSINDILVGMRRPGDGFGADDRSLERKGAIQMCVDRHSWQHQKHEGRWVEHSPSGNEIDKALNATKPHHPCSVMAPFSGSMTSSESR